MLHRLVLGSVSIFICLQRVRPVFKGCKVFKKWLSIMKQLQQPTVLASDVETQTFLFHLYTIYMAVTFIKLGVPP